MGLAILAYSAVTCAHAGVCACVLHLSVGKARDLSRGMGNKTYPVKQVGNTVAGQHHATFKCWGWNKSRGRSQGGLEEGSMIFLNNPAADASGALPLP